MNTTHLLAACALGAIATLSTGCASTCACGGEDRPEAAEAPADSAAMNSQCPIGHEPVVAEVGTVAYKGEAIGFCCPGCMQMWKDMPEAEKDEFVASAHQASAPAVEG